MRFLYVNVLVLFSSMLFAQVPCTGGMSGIYPCSNVDMQSFIPKASMGATGNLNDVWGWTDPISGKEYALVGMNNGTSFIDVSDPVNPVYLGILPTNTVNSSWRDIKVINDFAFIGSEAGGHGIQSFDLSQLGAVASPPVTFTALDVLVAPDFGSSHNVVAMEDSDHLVVVGNFRSGTYGGGLVFVDVSDPSDMKIDGSFTSDGYSHDAVCFTYRGPDTEHYGKRICIGSNEDTQTIVDVTDTQNPVQLSRTGYILSNYTHQSWVTDDHKYLLFDDELDERNLAENTRTYVMDISDLDNPIFIDYYQAPRAAIDHNLYIKGQYAFQAHYRAGFRMLDVRNTHTANFSEVAFFDTYPANDNASFNSAWNVYPYFKSGNILVSDIEQGLFVLKPTFPFYTLTSDLLPKTAIAGEDLTFSIDLESYGGYSNMVSLSLDTDIPSSLETFASTSVAANGSTTLTISDTDMLEGPYHLVIQARGPGDDIVHDFAISFEIIPRLYVDQTTSSSGDGSRWDEAFKTIQEALTATPVSGAEIWVAEGNYLTTTGSSRSISFVIPDGARLYGGFDGSEMDINERDVTNNTTILSGNIGSPAATSDNSYHVVSTSGTRSECTLDGFTISGGNANASGNTTGGGLLSSNFSTVLRNCSFTDNFALSGSAIYNTGSKLVLKGCTITGLDAEMMVTEESDVVIEGQVFFSEN